MTHLTVSVLGDLQVLVDDVPISSFKSEKVRALLVYLAVEADGPHRRETLIGLLWPDYPESTARHSLRQALFNLRLALGDHTTKPPFLLITRDSIQFNRESDYSLDLDQFNAYLSGREIGESREHVDSSILIPQLEEMVKLYRGEFLQHFFLGDSAEFEEWILVQRETTHQRIMEALTTLANDSEQRTDFQNARRYAMRQLELDPWREEAHCQIMRLLALDGQRSAALAQYETCRRVLAEELGVEPSSKTRDLYEQIRSGSLKPKSEPPAHIISATLHNIPVLLTPFIGRERELFDLSRLIAEQECRCITLVGPGGIGKTRLALQAAEQCKSEFAHGTAFIPLAPVGSIEAVVPAIASGIGFAFYRPTDPKIQLFNHLRDKQMLLVLDNVEQLLVEGSLQGTIPELLIEILQQAAQVKLLATSREAINIQGEWLFEVQGLAFPMEEQTGGMDEYDAVTLFVQRARRARPGWAMNEEDKLGVVRLCRLVEGMPLAIELAATWTRLLSPCEIAAEIEHSLDFLNAQMRDIPYRHRSMRAVFDHSWQALSDEEKQVLSRLSVFQGGFQRQAAEKVAKATLSGLSSLMTRSMLRRTATGRYDLHELIRQYSALKLEADALELKATQERHSLYYLGLLEEKDVWLRSQHQKETLAELSREMDNIRAAWNWSIRNQQFIPLYRASAALLYLYELRDWFLKEGDDTFFRTTEALRTYIQAAQPEDVEYPVALNVMLAYRGYSKFRQGKSEEAYAILAPSVAFLRTGPDPSAVIDSLVYLGILWWELGKFSEAKESLQESLRLSQKYGKSWQEATAGEFLGVVVHDQGEFHQAKQFLTEALAIYRQLGDPSMTAHGLSYLGRTLLVLREYPEAEKLLREGLGLTREIDYRFGTGLTLDALGQVTYAQGRYEDARVFFSECVGLFQEMGDPHRLSVTLNHQGLNLLALGQVTEARNAFIDTLRMAQEGGLIPSALNALAGLAALETKQKPGQDTLELVMDILQHPSSNKEAKDLAFHLQAELESKLTLEEIEAANAHAGSKSLDELTARFR